MAWVIYFSFGNTKIDFFFNVGDSKEQAVNFSGYELHSCLNLKFRFPMSSKKF